MKKIFEDEFMDLQSEFVSLCLELTSQKVDSIFIYISIEKHSRMFNVFFMADQKIRTLNQLDLDSSLIMQFLKIGTEDIERIKTLCKEYDMKIPSEMKMSYEVHTGKYNVDLKYDPICSAETDISAAEVFMSWIREKEKALNIKSLLR